MSHCEQYKFISKASNGTPPNKCTATHWRETHTTQIKLNKSLNSNAWTVARCHRRLRPHLVPLVTQRNRSAESSPKVAIGEYCVTVRCNSRCKETPAIMDKVHRFSSNTSGMTMGGEATLSYKPWRTEQQVRFDIQMSESQSHRVTIQTDRRLTQSLIARDSGRQVVSVSQVPQTVTLMQLSQTSEVLERTHWTDWTAINLSVLRSQSSVQSSGPVRLQVLHVRETKQKTRDERAHALGASSSTRRL